MRVTYASISDIPVLAAVTTQAVTDIGTDTATGRGSITDLGVPDPTAHGVCWNTSGSPTTGDPHNDNGAASATGAFTSSMTGLSPNTTYHVRAYATNTVGTAYGNEVTFSTTGAPPPMPIPSLSEWGIIILALAMLGIGGAAMRRRKTPLMEG